MNTNYPTFVIAAGHGWTPDNKLDKGAFNKKDNVWEYDLNTRVVSQVVNILDRYMCKVICDENLLGKAKDPNWKGLLTYLKTNNIEADFVLEVHHDSADAANAGFCILPKRVNKTANCIANCITDQYKLRGLKTKPNYTDVRGLGLLNFRAAPTLILECRNTANYDNITVDNTAKAIVDAFKTVFKLKQFTYIDEYDTAKNYLRKLYPNILFEDALIEWKKKNNLHLSYKVLPYMIKILERDVQNLPKL